MTFFHASSKPISRADGRSAVASAAYRAACALKDERTGIAHDYLSKPGVIHAGVILPAGAPDRLADRGRLWNEAEAAETRVNSRVAREFEFALPRHLSDAENIALARAFVQEAFVERYGVAADVAIHKPDASNIHCHAMMTTREVGPDGLGAKIRDMDRREALLQQRELLAVRTNQALARAGIKYRVDHRSYKDRALGIEPKIKLGPVVAKMQREGTRSDRAATALAIARENGDKIIADPAIGLKVLTEHQSTFIGHDIAKLASRYSDDEAQFRHVMAAIRAHPDCVRIGKDADGNDRYSTRAMIAIERAMAEHAASLAGQGGHALGFMGFGQARAQDRALEGAGLGSEQKEAFRHITKAGGLALVVGHAGTGKSRMLGAARATWEGAGYRVRGATLSGIASEALETGSGIKSRTIASLEYEWAQGKAKLDKNDVLVIDEAGMVGSRQMERVLRHAREAGAKVVLVGDHEQLQAIGAGAPFRALAEKHGCAKLEAVRRQRTLWMREAAKELATERAEAALRRYHDAGMVREERTREEARWRLVAMWDHDRQQRPDRTQIILTHTNAEVAHLNVMAREAMRAAGDLKGADVVVATERGEKAFAVGDRVLALKNDRALGIKNGSIGTVRAITQESMVLQLDEHSRKGAGREVVINLTIYSHLAHGYVVTIHKSQGITVRDATVLATPGMDRHLAYVALTRHIRRVDLVYAREDFKEGFDGMARKLGRDGRKDLTLDYPMRRVNMVRRKQDAHVLYGTADMRAEDIAKKGIAADIRARAASDAWMPPKAAANKAAVETDFQRRIREIDEMKAKQVRSAVHKI